MALLYIVCKSVVRGIIEGSFFACFLASIPFMIFWFIYFYATHQVLDLLNMIYLLLFFTMLCTVFSSSISSKTSNAFIAVYFYTPNILQTFLIMLKWPMDFYFVK